MDRQKLIKYLEDIITSSRSNMFMFYDDDWETGRNHGREDLAEDIIIDIENGVYDIKGD